MVGAFASESARKRRQAAREPEKDAQAEKEPPRGVTV